MTDVEHLVEMIAALVRAGKSPLQAVKDIAMLLVSNPDGEVLLRKAQREYEVRTGRIRTLKDPPCIVDARLESWYLGPSSADRFWPPLRAYLEKKWLAEDVAALDQASTRIVSLLQPPGRTSIRTRGLVVGYVQSGKTANFTAVIAKAADVNYKFFIVLSGITNALRSQTQRRLESELIALSSEHWITLTTVQDDFRPGNAGNVNAFLTEHQNLKVLCVIKKNSTVLGRLLKWLSGASDVVLSTCPVLIIDDEADQASINVSKDAAKKRSAINDRLIELMQKLPKVAYVGYTATPFANVLIDPSIPEDLYPRDFIISLPRPSHYFGAERLFGRERLWREADGGSDLKLDMVRIVPNEDAAHLQPGLREKGAFQPEMRPSLRSALHYFILAAAARLSRGQRDAHITMLIHTSGYTFVHDACRPMVEAYVQQFKQLFKTGNAELLIELCTMWEQEQQRVKASEFGEQPISFEEVHRQIPSVLAKITVVVDNYKSQQRLSYDEPSTIQIVIGGDTLSRGLTLEGLTVSYFLRSASAYDTLLQMGRWFGYRPHYADLMRMWMTMELAHYFYDLATIEEEIRIDIRRYSDENVTPLDFAVRVRTHPNLNITSALKMDAAVPAFVSYNNRRVQTVLFKRKNLEWLNHNLRIGQRLVKQLINLDQEVQALAPNTYRFQHVPVSFVLDFLRDYRFHEESTELASDLLVRYIQDLNEINDLLRWNIVISGGSMPRQIDLGGIIVNTVKRTRRNETREDAHIGALMSEGDVNIDQAVNPELIRGKSDTEALQYRPQGIGLLILYPIDKHSGRGESMSERRAELDAAADILGIGLVFPNSKQFIKHMYMSADLSRVPREYSEWDMDEGEEL
jgi:hypothetical protein